MTPIHPSGLSSSRHTNKKWACPALTKPFEDQVKQNIEKTKQEVNKVYKTSDLSIFKQIDGNRVPNLQHIKRLADSIRVYGMKCNPILVNERMEVIDGQHRLMAAKEVKSFVYYIKYGLQSFITFNTISPISNVFIWQFV